MSIPFNLVRRVTAERGDGVIVWMLNIGAEKYWNQAPAGVTDRAEDRLVNRTEEMNLLLCRKQDILLLRETPDAAYLAQLEEWGFDVPRIWVPAPSDPWTPIAELVLGDEALLDRLAEVARTETDVTFVPYAVTRLEEQIAARCGLRLAASPAASAAAVNDKIYNREIAERLGLPVCRGRVCATADEIREAYRELAGDFGGRVIIKEPFGASGKGLYLVDSEDQLHPILLRAGRQARQRPDSRWLVEGWYEKQADVNYQIYVSPAGEVEVFSLKRQVLRDTVYIGSQLPAELGEDVEAKYQAYGQAIGRHLYETGYSGVAGVDSIIAADGTVFPVVEINGRFTLSSYISFLGRAIAPDRKVFSRYFRYQGDAPMDYAALRALLEDEGLWYRRETGEGVLVYTAGTLPLEPNGTGAYAGRIFTLIAARTWEGVESRMARLESLLESRQRSAEAQRA